MSETCDSGSVAALGDRLRAACARRELHVGLAQQRLLAQDRLRVRRQRRVARLQLDLDVRAPGDLVRRDLLDLADRHAADPHVGLQRELPGLGERRVEAVALRLQRHRAAEREPQEQQQPEARQREQHHRRDLAEGGSVLDHRLSRRPAPGSKPGRSSAVAGALSSSIERAELRVGLRDRVQQLRGRARQHDQAAPDRAVRVRGREQRVARVVDPRLPEQEALLLARPAGCRRPC